MERERVILPSFHLLLILLQWRTRPRGETSVAMRELQVFSVRVPTKYLCKMKGMSLKIATGVVIDAAAHSSGRKVLG